MKPLMGIILALFVVHPAQATSPHVIYFKPGSIEFTSMSKTSLFEIAREQLRRCATPQLTIIGNANRLDGQENNIAVSRGRADAVAEWFRTHNFPEESLSVLYRGDKDPARVGHHVLNSRVEIHTYSECCKPNAHPNRYLIYGGFLARSNQ